MFAKLFFHAILVSLAISEISGMVRGKREAEDLQCPTSQIELSGTEWGILSGILGHLGHLQTRSKRSSESPMDIAKILPNHELCFAGHKLIFKVPDGEAKAEKFREALNTFILMMSHLHGGHSGYYNTV